MTIKSNIRSIRIIAFFLFLIPTLALIGSLIAHNVLVSLPFIHENDYKFEKVLPGISTQKHECNEKNGYCNNLYKLTDKLNKCNKFELDVILYSSTDQILSVNDNTPLNKKISEKTDQKIFKQWKITDKLNKNCIINTNLNKLYNFSPTIFETIYKIQTSENTELGTSFKVNPILYGETSISNIVKRFPIKLIFKPLMYIGVILMIFYWYYNNLILNKLLNVKIKNKFFIFGILSAIFLLLHVIFLGWTFESDILNKIRRYYIVFFILFEILAQAYLIKEIFKKKTLIIEYLNNLIVYCKLIFVFFICISTLAILIILSIFNLEDKVDYILEWNYFLILLVFYLLSSVMWASKS